MFCAYRISRDKWADNFSQAGMRGGRWNAPGSLVVYTASSIALALLEILVHVQRDQIPDHYVYRQVSIPRDLVITIAEMPESTVEFGTKWLQSGRKAVLQIPSVIVPEPNFLLNPDHPDFPRLVWSSPQKLIIDERLLQTEAAV